MARFDLAWHPVGVEDDLVVQQRIAEAIEEVLPLQVNEQRVMNE